MTVVINGYEVEIKAKRVGNKKSSEKDTMRILSTIEGWAWDSAYRSEKMGFLLCAKSTSDDASSIHSTLSDHGYFDDVQGFSTLQRR